MKEIPVYKISDFNSALFPDSKLDNLEFEIKPNFPNVTNKAFSSYFRSDFFTILLVIEGEMNISINLKEYFVEKNVLILNAPNDVRQFIYNDKTAISYVVAFSAKYFSTTEHARQRLDTPNYFSPRFSPIWKLSSSDANILHKLLRDIYKRKGKVKDHIF